MTDTGKHSPDEGRSFVVRAVLTDAFRSSIRRRSFALCNLLISMAIASLIIALAAPAIRRHLDVPNKAVQAKMAKVPLSGR